MHFRNVFSAGCLGLFCYLSVPYQYCYSLVNKIETQSEIKLYFEKNSFFQDCSVTKNVFLETTKDIVVDIDGTEARHRNDDLCIK